MNVTQEKMVLLQQINAAKKDTMLKILKENDRTEERDLSHLFLVDMIHFFENKSESFYRNLKTKYDIDDFVIYVDLDDLT